ncbi:MAG: hypothetical protein IE891_08245 [Flavobacteriaceae bacterium]|nr:hypothetical protein [Flavobacteriaceae bacterium]
MTVKQQFLQVHHDIIRNLDNRFVKYLDANISVLFEGDYPQSNEVHLQAGTFNFQVKVNNVFYSPYSDEFFELTSRNTKREYVVKYSFLHNYCFDLFCTYFEIISNGLSAETARQYLSEYEFFLNIQLGTNNHEYKDSYRHYWREILLRVIHVLVNGGHSFYQRFDETQRKEIINDLERIEKNIRN